MCPKCESKEIGTMGRGTVFMMACFLFFATMVLGLLFPLFWILSAVFLLAIPASLLTPKHDYCKQCNHVWRHKIARSQ